MAIPFYNVLVSFYKTNFANGNQVLIFSVKGFMYAASPAEKLVLPLGPDPTNLTFYHIIIDGIAVNPGLVRFEPGNELVTTMLDPAAFGLDGRWRVQSDPESNNGGQGFSNLNHIDTIVQRVVK
jgi:hypothetical protein